MLNTGDRVTHSNPARSYGAGIVMSAGTETATVRFDGERGHRLVRTRDLSPEAKLPLAVRVPARRTRVVYPVQP
ncbi:hypothetical protein [Nitrobacter sp.]|uniref:hypothetical protein n=1 Tax=Nitrobacter sp. TaxID=29420 RepID=UPI0029CABA75|nr:hypothetical protein [Nitrobacter sp.]